MVAIPPSITSPVIASGPAAPHRDLWCGWREDATMKAKGSCS